MNRPEIQSGAISKFIFRVAPFFLSALLFQSPLFAILSPLPLFLLTLRNRIQFSLIALITNLLITAYFKSPGPLWIAGAFWLGVGVVFPFLIRKTGKIQMSATLSYLFLVLVYLSGVFVLAHQAGMNPIDYARNEINIGMDHLIQMPSSPVKKLVEEEGREGLFKQLMTELPSGLLIALLISFWVNLLFASQWLVGFLSKTFWSQFRNPEWLVWPTLLCGGLFALTDHAPYLIGLNGFKLFLTLYALQGLSILSFVLNRAKINGFIRTVLFGIVLMVAMPLLIGFGFFDLWFDFRRKFGQS